MANRKVLHISTECFPAAKAGGMADVVGALPKYLPPTGWSPSVVTPKYALKWYDQQTFRNVYSGSFNMEGKLTIFDVYKAKKGTLPFDYYCIDIPGRFDRDSIYLNEHGHGFHDEFERNISFQRSVLDWLSGEKTKTKFDILHCHDHQVGFIPFLTKKVKRYDKLKKIPSVYTIHNGAYNSRLPWTRLDLLPQIMQKYRQYIEWDGHIDAVAAALRFSDHINTVSPSYLQEIKQQMPALQFLIDKNEDKYSGILNGIDHEVWNPKTDPYLKNKLTSSTEQFKKSNKAEILSGLYHLAGIPLISFIGRFAHQKGADLLVPAVERILSRFGFVNFYILGSGDTYIEQKVQELRDKYAERVACYIGYNEELAHKIYAASDFLVMPSRFEPCGLNQMFSMRYGGLPIARKTGGLIDTVIDFEEGGAGVSFQYDSIDDLTQAISRALYLYKDTKKFRMLRSGAMKLNYSWTQSAQKYSQIYNQLI